MARRFTRGSSFSTLTSGVPSLEEGDACLPDSATFALRFVPAIASSRAGGVRGESVLILCGVPLSREPVTSGVACRLSPLISRFLLKLDVDQS